MEGRLEKEIQVPIKKITLTGDLIIPDHAKGLIVFAHGSGSSRLSIRNKQVASTLQEAGFGTLLFDLLTAQEDEDRLKRFDIDLLTERLIKVTDWLRTYPGTSDLAIGYFGASTGAASALNAAAKLGRRVAAVVSRGGRPDMAERSLPEVTSPTLLIVGSLDSEVVTLNEKAYSLLSKAVKEIKVIPGASHLFEEPGKLQAVSVLAVNWFNKYVFTPEK